MTWEQLQKYLPGKRVLIGLTFVDSNEALIEQYQTHGTIQALTNDGMIRVARTDGTVFQMPYDKNTMREAAKGEYRERSTGAVVKDPDFIMTWEIIVGDGDDLESAKKYGYIPD